MLRLSVKALLVLSVVYVGQGLADISQSCEEIDSLECAIHAGSLDDAERLLTSGADPNSEIRIALDPGSKSKNRKWPALLFSIANGNEDIALLLLKHGADPLYDNRGRILYSAINAEMNGVVEFITSQPNFKSTVEVYEAANIGLINLAVNRGDFDLVNFLLGSGFDLYKQTKSASYLRESLHAGNESMLRLFLAHGIEITKVNDKDSLILHASNSTYPGMMAELIKRNMPLANYNSAESTPFHQASLNCRHQEWLMSLLLKQNIPACEESHGGGSVVNQELLLRKAGKSVLSTFSLKLLEEKWGSCETENQFDDVFALDVVNATSNGAYVINDCADVQCALLSSDDKKAAKVIKDQSLRYDTSVTFNGVEFPLIRWMLALGENDSAINLVSSDFSCSASNQLSLFHEGLSLGRFRFLNYLLANDPQFDQYVCADEFELNPLHQSVLAGDYSMAEKLLSSGQSVNQKDAFGLPPVAYALAFGMEDFVTLFLDHDADMTFTSSHNQNASHMAALGDVDLDHFMTMEEIAPLLGAIDSVFGRNSVLTGMASDCPYGYPALSVKWGSADDVEDKFGLGYSSYTTVYESEYEIDSHVYSKSLQDFCSEDDHAAKCRPPE